MSLTQNGYLNALALIDILYYKNFKQLLTKQTPEELWDKISENLLSQLRIKQEDIHKILTKYNKLDPTKAYERLAKENIKLINKNEEDYPANLKEIYNPPELLYYKGVPIWKETKNHTAIVGTRNPTPYGESACKDICQELCKHNHLIISGLATGIDATAHRSTLASKGKTIAILGTGVNIYYPEKNTKLHDEIAATGALISEFPFDSPPLKWHFPTRNRIISGIAEKVIIIEGSKKSGSLITAKIATEQNKEVYALPGSIYASQSSGTHYLIQEGAQIITSFTDLTSADELTPQGSQIPTQETFFKNLSKEEQILYDLVANCVKTAGLLENIYEESGFTYPLFNKTITSLELKGLISRLPGQRLIIT